MSDLNLFGSNVNNNIRKINAKGNPGYNKYSTRVINFLMIVTCLFFYFLIFCW